MLATSPHIPLDKLNSVVRFDVQQLVEYFLPYEWHPLPTDLRRTILLFSGHIRIGTRSFLYVYYP